jgi:hypothetical protein
MVDDLVPGDVLRSTLADNKRGLAFSKGWLRNNQPCSRGINLFGQEIDLRLGASLDAPAIGQMAAPSLPNPVEGFLSAGLEWCE